MIEDIRNKDQITRQDIADLLSSIGKPGECRDEKLKQVSTLRLANSQGVTLEEDLNSYAQW